MSKRMTVAWIAALLWGLLLAGIALAANGYTLSWWSVDGGGGTCSSGGYTLSGIIGQPDAGTMSNGGYTLAGGFWGGAGTAPEYKLYLPLVLRQHS